MEASIHYSDQFLPIGPIDSPRGLKLIHTVSGSVAIPRCYREYGLMKQPRMMQVLTSAVIFRRRPHVETRER
jgi:hypothetical protein